MSSAALIRKDIRELPRYTVTETSAYLRLPESTIRVWFFGQANFERLFVPASDNRRLLSFFNLVEAHAVAWTKKRYPQLRVPKIRAALEYVRQKFPQFERPLVTKRFSTEGRSLFLERLEDEDTLQAPIDAGNWGQLALPVMSEYLELIEYDDRDLARLLYPHEGKHVVVINPAISSGRPIVKGTGVLASIIWQRAKRAREPVDRLARDYKLDPSEIQAAIDYFEAA